MAEITKEELIQIIRSEIQALKKPLEKTKERRGKQRLSLLKKIRQEKNITAQELAQKSWISRPTLAKLEGGDQSIRRVHGEAIARVLGVEVDDLFYLTNSGKTLCCRMEAR